MLLLAPMLEPQPLAALAAIVIVFSMGLILPVEFASVRGVRKMAFQLAVAAFLGVLVFRTLQGIVVTIILSLLDIARQASHPNVHVVDRKAGEDALRALEPRHPGDELIVGLLLVRPDGRLFFANAQQVGDQARAPITRY